MKGRTDWIRALLLAALACLAPGMGLAAEELTSAFEAANKLYETGNYESAAQAYDAIIAEGNYSPALFFNLGNAWFRAGQPGRAIAAYRQAERLAPRDPDIQANLRFVLSKVTGNRPEEINPARRRFAGFTLNEWTWLAMIALWVWMILLALREFRPQWKPSLKNYTMFSGLLTAALIALAWIAKSKLDGASAVVIVSEAVVRYGPLEESQSAFTLNDGIELDVIDRKDGWLRVADPEARTGWIQEDHVIVWERL